MGIPAGEMGGDQRLVCAGGITGVETDPPQFVERPPELPSQVGTQLLAGHEDLPLGLDARPAEPENLGAVDSATPMETADGVGLAPPLHRLRPLLRDVVLPQALQSAHEFAVDDAGRQWIELA